MIEKTNQRAIKVASFLRLTDENCELSLTNLAFYIVLWKIALTPAALLSIGEIAVLLPVIINYGYKRHALRAAKQAESAQVATPPSDELARLRDDLNALTYKVNFNVKQNKNNSF